MNDKVLSSKKTYLIMKVKPILIPWIRKKVLLLGTEGWFQVQNSTSYSVVKVHHLEEMVLLRNQEIFSSQPSRPLSRT